MKKIVSLWLSILLLMVTWNDSIYAATVQIENETVWKDLSNNTIRAQGGSIIKHDGYYYWFGMEFPDNYIGDTTYYFNAINCYRSIDLKNWTFRGNILTKQATGYLSEDHWVGRPSVTYNSSENNFVLHFEWGAFEGAEGEDGIHGNRLAVATCSTIDGSYVWQGQTKIDGYTIGDLSIFKDSDGEAYAVYVRHEMNADPENAATWNERIAVTKLSSDYLSPEQTIWSGFVDEHREAPFIMKKGTTYYLFSSFTDYWYSTETKYAMSSSLSGSWSSKQKLTMLPDSTNSFNSQMDFVIPVQGSVTTSYIYCGDRWSNFDGAHVTYKYNGDVIEDDYYNSGIGRYVWAPMYFEGTTPKVYWGKKWSVDTETGIWNIDNYGTNVVTNWGFENDHNNWDSWGNSTVITNNVYSGAKVMRIGSSEGGVGQEITSDIKEGNIYCLGAWAKVSKAGESGWLVIEAFDEFWNKLGSAATEVTNTSYEYNDITFSVPEGTTMLRAVIWKDQNNGGYFYVDDLTISN